VIGAIADGPDLERVLHAVIDLLVEATACHASFIYLREDDRLRIRAASPVFAHVVGRVSLHISEGLIGWVARTRTPAFIREAALDDPRVTYVPELEEERFQSMVAVPLVGRHGDDIGVVVLHTEAPREFGKDIVDFLVHVRVREQV
jgi:signal transduction protein with GAF and PtsI domain